MVAYLNFVACKKSLETRSEINSGRKKVDSKPLLRRPSPYLWVLIFGERAKLKHSRKTPCGLESRINK